MGRAVRADPALLRDRLVEHADERPRAIVQSDEDSPLRLAADERARTVDRVEDPRVRLGAVLFTVLLADHAVERIALRDELAHHRLALAVGLGDGIVAGAAGALVDDVEPDAEPRPDHLARRIGELVRKVEELRRDDAHYARRYAVLRASVSTSSGTPTSMRTASAFRGAEGPARRR